MANRYAKDTIPNSIWDLRGDISTRDRELSPFGGDEMRNPKTVLGITKATTSGQKRKEHGEAPGCLGGGQIPKTSGDVKDGN